MKDEFQARNIQLVQEKLNLMGMNQAQRQAYQTYLINRVVEQDMMEAAKAEAIAKGRQSEKMAIARKLLAEGLGPELVGKLTELTEAEVRGLGGDG